MADSLLQKVLLALLLCIVTLQGSTETTLQCIEHALQPSSTECYYPDVSASEALKQLRDKWIVFMGESALRQLFLQFVGIIKSEAFDRIPDQKENRKIEERLGGSRFTFYYLEYFDNITSTLTEGAPQLVDGRYPDLLILNDGLHDLLYDHEQMQSAWDNLSALLVEFKQRHTRIPMMWIPSPQIHDEFLTKHRKESSWFRNESVAKMAAQQQQLYATGTAYHYYYDIFVNLSYSMWNFDGIHSMQRARLEAEGLVRALYYINHDSDTWMSREVTAGQVMTFVCYSIIWCIVAVGQVCKYLFYKKLPKEFIKSSSAELQRLLHDDKEEDEELGKSIIQNGGDSEQKADVANTTGPEPISSDGDTANNQRRRQSSPKSASKDEHATKKKAEKVIEDEYELRLPPFLANISLIRIMLNNYISQQANYIAFWQLGLCLMLLYLFDGPQHLFISPSLKHYDRDYFIFLHVIFLAVSWLTFTKNPAKDSDRILSRLQTEEWKGIMQIVFVMYHYYDAAEVYNLIRVFIAAYVWMTGFGNTSFFISKNIYNLNRLLGMLFRLNWLVFWCCLLLNQPLMLYYICPLHTFFFLFTYATWGCFYQFNDRFGVKEVKLLVSGLLLCILFETHVTVFETFWAPLFPLLQLHGTLHEWHFRTTLDHYATWLGMVFAVYYESVYKFLSVSLKNRIREKWAIAGVAASALLVWYEAVYKHDKFRYNAMHPYTAIIPIAAYIALRNLHDGWRAYYSRFLAWMGQITLETYIFQYHLYMISDAKTILTVLPSDYPLCNFLVVSAFYVCISRIAFDATNTLRNAFYPPRSKDSNQTVAKHTAVYLALLCVAYITSYIVALSLSS